MSIRYTINLGPWLLGLTFLFAIFKVTGLWQMSWMAVLCPLWLPVAFFVGVMCFAVATIIFVLLVAGCVFLFEELSRR